MPKSLQNSVTSSHPYAAATTTTTTNNNNNNNALLIYAAPVVQRLSTSAVRLEPTYVGVRRVRPSSRVVQQAMLQSSPWQETQLCVVANNTNNTITNSSSPQQQQQQPQQQQSSTNINNGNNNNNQNIVFKVVEQDGTERRMTKQEKKAVRYQLLQERKEAKREQRLLKEAQTELQQQASSTTVSGGKSKKGKKRSRNETTQEEEQDIFNKSSNATTTTTTTTTTTNNDGILDADSDSLQNNDDDDDSINNTLLQVGVALPPPKTSLQIEQELADLRGEREGVPPVMLASHLANALVSNPTAQQASGILTLPMHTENDPCRTTTILRADDDLAREWAAALVESMQPALGVRRQEDMRKMAYAILPEVWTRLRPESLLVADSDCCLDDNNSNSDKSKHSTAAAEAATGTATTAVKNTTIKSPLQDDKDQSELVAALVSIRPPSLTSFDSDLNAVVKLLHQNTSLYISCGAKFGCDLLIYDGKRRERHAFAGLRLVVADTSTNNSNNAIDSSPSTKVTTTTQSFPTPSAYCLAGYVRCLNTAGKLALLATVRREIDPADGSTTVCRVAIVDLKLERLDGTKKKNVDKLLKKLDRSSVK